MTVIREKLFPIWASYPKGLRDGTLVLPLLLRKRQEVQDIE